MGIRPHVFHRLISLFVVNLAFFVCVSGHLYFLNRDSGDQQENIPHAIDTWHRMINLRHFRLGRGTIQQLPNSLCKLRSLQLIDVGMNGIQYLPPDMGNLEGLTHLDVSSNKLFDVPPSLGRATSLEKLILNNNQLSEIPVSCSCLTNLKIFDMRQNNIKALPPNLGVVTSLRTLRLEDNPLVDFQISKELIKKGVTYVLWELRRLYNLQKFGPAPNVSIKGRQYCQCVFMLLS